MPRLKPRRSCLLSSPSLAGLVVAIGVLGSSASAQTALGDGHALDANTGQRGTRNFQRPNFAEELRFRNSIATGNAPGGLSFRGDLGYRAAGEFSGALGSDSLFAFRRDSLYSGLAGMGIRGTDAVQYQFALTTGAAPPRNLMGNLSVSRDRYYPANLAGRGASSQMGNSAVIGIDPESSTLDLRGKNLSVPVTNSAYASGYEPEYEMGSMLGTLRSSSTYSTTLNLQPALLSLYREGVNRKPIGLIASPLLGVTSIPMAVAEEPNPLVARPSVNPNTLTEEAPTRRPGSVVSMRMTTSYEGLVEEMRQQVEVMRERNIKPEQSSIKSDESNNDWLTRQMNELRAKLYGTVPANDGDPDASPENSDEQSDADSEKPSKQPGTIELIDPTQPMNTDFGTNQPVSDVDRAVQSALDAIGPNSAGAKVYDPTAITIDPETLEVLRGAAAKQIEQYYDPGAVDRDIFGEHMSAGQRLIHNGRYFDAEERFTHALSIRPGDVSSQLGRFHAQIGAGMVLSASANLQALFTQYPEMIASRYTGELLPAPERIETLLERLKERAGISMPEFSSRTMDSDRVRISASLLLAYLGYQVEDRESLDAGLAMVMELGSDADRRFASVLAQLWANPEEPGSQPGSRPSSPDAHTETERE